jgi:hypothetical protein
MVTRIFTGTLLGAAAAIAAVAAGAQAGSYHVYACRTPSGESAPADGWSGSKESGGAYDDYAVNTCDTGGALIAALGDATTHLANVDRVTWRFEAPPFAKVVNATIRRAAYLHGHGGEKATYQSWLAGPTATDVFEECIFSLGCTVLGEPTKPMSASNTVDIPGVNHGPRLYLNVSCASGISGSECGDSFSDANNYAAVIYLFASDMVLEQNAGPTASNVSGELASAPAVAGTSDLAFSATDPGAGVYEAVFTLDGQPAQSTVLDSNGGRCRDVGQTGDGLAAFLYIQPCLGSLSSDVAFDTSRFANGTHHLQVSVIDAAGNSAPVLDRNIVIANPAAAGGQGSSSAAGFSPGPPNGTNASDQASLAVAWKGSRSARLVSPFGRSRTVLGRLTGPGGVPISGAQIDVQATPSFTGATTAAMVAPRTAADGSFSLRIPAAVSSRTLRFGYRSHLGDPLPVVTRTLTLTVHAALRLTISPRLTGVGRRIFFSGRLLGGPLPATGKLLVLEARSGGRSWIKFNVVRSDRRGRFHASYRFKFPGPTTYRFRVLSEAEADYPYASAASRSVLVRER